MKNKLKIALLLGGASPERQVSKSTGKSIYNALHNLGHEVILVDPAYGENQPKTDDEFFAPADIFNVGYKNYVASLKYMKDADLAFLALHGKYGEDGTIQSLLELSGIKYTGAGVMSSSLSMDKNMSKIMFERNGVACPKGFTIKAADDPKKAVERIKKELGFPCIVKPNDQGSTIGLTICKAEADVPGAIKAALDLSDQALIEEYIEGRELTVAVLDRKSLPVCEISPKHNHYDYECKYTSGMSEYIVPAKLPEDVTKHLQAQALLAYDAVQCKTYGRVDFRLTPDFKSYCLEINTLPGMTSTSLVPKMARAAGIEFDDLIKKIIELSL
ncbi:MAG TPA: D-alanine--D-alanine ligase [Ignavibacteriales bacterium]|nr:D-alanine--D-alanine ligase [Ignavibacteriales bacterium]